MDEERKAKYEEQSQQLRLELKQWEVDYAQNHDGKKPPREAIKQNPDIAEKYKKYNKLRDILSGKIPPPKSKSDSQKDPSQQRKRKQPETSLPSASTPSKRNKSAATPKSQHYSAVDEAITPEVARRLFSPVVPSSIGPTPQKDGRVLGLFDLISHTPSKSTDDSKPRAAGFTATPSKRRHALDLENDDDDKDGKEDNDFITPSIPRHRNLDRTPSSGRNRNLLDSFLGVRPTTNTASTPLSKNIANSPSKYSLGKTPTGERSVSKLQFATPAFLRRTSAPLPPLDENSEWMDIEPLKLPRKPFSIAKGRGLSSIVADLRKMEEEKADEELEMLREMEAMEQGGDMGPPPPKKTAATSTTQPSATTSSAGPEPEEEPNDFEDDEAALIEVEASFLESPSSKRKKERKQHPERPVLLSGFDDENIYDSQDDVEMSKEGLDRNGQPLRVFKKKGQKRTTKKVNMRPTRTKRPSKPVAEEDDDDSEEEDSDEEVVPETQFDATKNAAVGGQDDLLRPESEPGSGSGSEFDGSEGEEDEEAETNSRQAAKKKASAKEKEKKDLKNKKTKDKKKKDTDEEPAKKPRMVKATANANFKRLKLKNTGSKGGPAHNSRFRRRR